MSPYFQFFFWPKGERAKPLRCLKPDQCVKNMNIYIYIHIVIVVYGQGFILSHLLQTQTWSPTIAISRRCDPFSGVALLILGDGVVSPSKWLKIRPLGTPKTLWFIIMFPMSFWLGAYHPPIDVDPGKQGRV